jgi:hypothetical protein
VKTCDILISYCTSSTASAAACDLLFQALEAAAADPQLQGVREELKITGFERYSRAILEQTHCVEQQQQQQRVDSGMPSSLSPKRLLCPYQVAVSRLFLRARGSYSV